MGYSAKGTITMVRSTLAPGSDVCLLEDGSPLRREGSCHIVSRLNCQAVFVSVLG